MKKVLYLECKTGAAGDMLMGALYSLLTEEQKTIFLKKINAISEEVHVIPQETCKQGIGGIHMKVEINGEEEGVEHTHEHHHDHGEMHEHTHEHEHIHEHMHDHTHEQHSHEHKHTHVHRNFYDVSKIIDESSITESTKELAKKIFMRVALAEAKVHGKTLEEVHFHEVGALDSIVDIIGTAVLIDMIKPDKIVSSVIHDGHGFIMCQHGKIPVPVPATMEIFAAAGVKIHQCDVENEMVTPTGAAIIAELSENYGVCPEMKVVKTGYGAGKRQFDIPNVLRVLIGEEDD